MTRLVSDPVFSALTRPQMIAGVTYSFAVFNLIVTLEAFLITRSAWPVPAAALIHAIGYLGSRREPRFFDLWLTRLRCAPDLPNAWFWQANSYRP